MHPAYEESRERLANVIARFGAELKPVSACAPAQGVRFHFDVGPVGVEGALRHNLSFEIEAVDRRTGPLFRASHHLRDGAAVSEVANEAMRQIQEYTSKSDLSAVDWSNQGVPWWDASKDEYLARDWLALLPGDVRVGAYMGDPRSNDIEDRVLELTQTDLDPVRGWRLVKRLVELATTDAQLWRIGADALSTILREHEALVTPELKQLYTSDPKWRKTFDGQMALSLYRFKERVSRAGG